MKIFLADISHDTVGLATEVFPLNVGYVAAYAKKIFGDAIQISLFKYAKDLERAMRNDPPDLLGMSNYPWCHKIGLAFLEQLRDLRPEAIRIMGGPNFPHDSGEQRDFLAQRPVLDAYVYLEGEIGFTNLLSFALGAGGLSRVRAGLRETPIAGCCQLDPGGRLLALPIAARTKELDEIPSPYLSGLMDPFFDGRLSPMIQTHRGCPFRCTYCVDGSDLVNKVNQFSTERVIAEIDYIASRPQRGINTLHLADLNFGMFKRDAMICDAISASTARTGFPLNVETATGKNSKERIIGALEKLNGSLNMAMSVQSLTPIVLKNIKRDNIRLGDFLELRSHIKRANLPTSSEIILGLPGETLASHMESLNGLMLADIDRITPYTLMMLTGSELATPEQRQRWGFETRFRVLPRDFTQMENNGARVVEVEEVVVKTSTLSFDEYLQCRELALLISVLYAPGFKAVIKLLIQAGVRPIDVFLLLRDRLAALTGEAQPSIAADLLAAFRKETVGELWETEAALLAFFDEADNFQGLIEGRYGANLIHTYRAKIYARGIDELAARFFSAADILFDRSVADESMQRVMQKAQAYCCGIIHNLVGADRMLTVPEAWLDHDFSSWLDDVEGKPLEAFSWPRERQVKFILSSEQFQLLEDSLERCGRTDIGLGKALVRTNPGKLWRRPLVVE